MREQGDADAGNEAPQGQEDRERPAVRYVSEQRLNHGGGQLRGKQNRTGGGVGQGEPVLQIRQERGEGSLDQVGTQVSQREEEEEQGTVVHRKLTSAIVSFPSRSITSRSIPRAAPEQGGSPARKAARKSGSTGNCTPV